MVPGNLRELYGSGRVFEGQPAPLPADGPTLRRFFVAVTDALESALEDTITRVKAHASPDLAQQVEAMARAEAEVNRATRAEILNTPDEAALPEIRRIVAGIQASDEIRFFAGQEGASYQRLRHLLYVLN